MLTHTPNHINPLNLIFNTAVGGTLGGTSATGSFTVTAGSSFSSDSIRAIYVNNVQVNGSAVDHTGNNLVFIFMSLFIFY